MLWENCVKGLRVKILSKSVGGEFDRLNYRETTVDFIQDDEYDGEGIDVIVDIIGNYFLPIDLIPLGVINNA